MTRLDDDRLVADAGLLLPATLAQHLGLRELVDEHLHQGAAASAANAGDMRAECLDWTLIQGRRHLDRTLRTYAEHHNRGRPHRALGLAPPLAAAAQPIRVSPPDVRRRDLLGGLIHEYHGLAA